MTSPLRAFKYKGMIPETDQAHQVHDDAARIIAPTWVQVPGGKYVPQYSPTIVGKSIEYDPPNDCNGNFMSYKFQANNNCYNYSTNIASNSFAQPGRMHGLFLTSPPTGPQVVKGAEMDGLVNLGGTGLEDLAKRKTEVDTYAGHFVALLISPPDSSVGWGGDYHWVRCDNNSTLDTWSQKDGGDQVTNFDFAGYPITDPFKSNWTVNQGPISSTDKDDFVVQYDFYTFMYVPNGKVNII